MKSGVKAFVVYEKQLLLILRDNEPTIPYPNMWNLAGGGIDDGERPQQALQREIQEEIGIMPINITYLGKQLYEDGNIVYRYVITLTKREFEAIKLGNEGQKFQFFRLNDLGGLSIAIHSKEYIDKYMNQLKQLIEENRAVNYIDLGLHI